MGLIVLLVHAKSNPSTFIQPALRLCLPVDIKRWTIIFTGLHISAGDSNTYTIHPITLHTVAFQIFSR